MTTKTATPARTPTVAIGRALRGIGLKQGADFIVRTEYTHGGGVKERDYTRAVLLTNHAVKTTLDHKADVEEAAADNGWRFAVRPLRHDGKLLVVLVDNR